MHVKNWIKTSDLIYKLTIEYNESIYKTVTVIIYMCIYEDGCTPEKTGLFSLPRASREVKADKSFFFYIF